MGIFYKAGYWHLIAYCRLRTDYRDFRIDRVKTLRATDKHFVNQHPTLKEYIAKTAKERQMETVIVKVDKAIYPQLQNQKYYSGFVSERKAGDQMEMTFLTSSIEGFARWYMMFGDHAQIVQPDALRDRVKAIAEKLVRNNP